jgi:multiple sugar transport system permease protein
MRSPARTIVIYAGVALLVAWTLVPIYWLINMSLSHQAEIVQAHFIPDHPTLCNYVRIFSDTYPCKALDGSPYPAIGQATAVRQGLINSLIIAVIVTILTMAVSVPAAYAIGRLTFKGKGKLLLTIVMSRSYPPIAILIPFFSMYQKLQIQGTILGLIIIYLTLTIPLVVWILSGFFSSLPRSLERLARVDGCTPFQALYRVLIRVAMPGVTACAVIAFLTCWNEFTFALMLTPGSSAQTFPPALAAMFTNVSYPNENAAAALLALIPVMILAYLFQSRIRGLNLVDPL